MATDFDTARDQYENYRYCYDNGHHEWVTRAAKCFNFWNSEQWEAAIRAKLQREGRPALTLNVIRSLVRSAVGIQRALRHDVRFTPTYDATLETSRVMDAVWLHVQNENKLDFLETEVYKKGLIMGRAYYDTRVSYDQSAYGDVIIRSRRSQDVVLDPSFDEYDPDSWPQVFVRRWVSLRDIEHLYGKDKADALSGTGIPSWYNYEDQFMAQQMGRMPYYRDEGVSDTDSLRGRLLLERQSRVIKQKECFIDVKTGDVSEIPETWDRDRISRVLELVPDVSTTKRKMQTVRWSVTCEGETLHHEDSPYKHFTIVPFFPDFVDGVTAGLVEDLLDPQAMYNKITSQELHIINTTANSGLIVKTGAVKNMTIEEMQDFGSKSGVVFEVEDVETSIKKITPNATPQGHDRLSFKADAIMRSLSGVSNQARGFAREDVAGEAIEANQAAQDVNFADYLSSLHRSKQLLARNVLDLVQAHYTESRTIMINRGTALAPSYEEINLNQPTAEERVLNDVTRGRYSTTLVPAPSRTVMSEGDFALLLKLRTEVGIAIPDAMLIELSPAINKSQIIQQLAGESSEQERAMAEAEARKMAAEASKTEATAAKESSAANLNNARADKFAVEAASDPDASFERVEVQRMGMEQARHEDKMDLEYAKIDAHKQEVKEKTALQLTGMEVDRESKDADREVAKQKNTAAARREKKPPTKRKSA